MATPAPFPQPEFNPREQRLEVELRATHAELQRVTREGEQARAELARLYASRSWRVTLPLRRAAHGARALRTRLRGWKNALRQRVLAVVVRIYRGPLRPLLRPLAARYGGKVRQALAAPGTPVPEPPEAYADWVRRYDTLDDAERAAIRAHVQGLAHQPLISLVMPVYNTPERWLRLAIASVQAQLYPRWELCIADDASTQPHVRPLLERAAAGDGRIRLAFREANGGIAAASNTALALAGGEFVGLLDHDDELAEAALAHVASALNARPGLDFLYSDEDKLDEQGRRCDAYFKPDWNRELVLQQNYVCHFAVYRRQALEQVGGFRAGFEGSQDYDLMLRVTERLPAGHIHHIPHVLYRWRKIAGSTALAVENKGYAEQAARRAVQEHLERTGTRARVENGLVPHRHRVRYEVPDPQPLVSIIIPTRDGYALLRQCIDSILKKTTYQNYEILVVDNQSRERRTLEYLQALERAGQARVLPYDQPFNFSAINNFAVDQARGEVVCLLNNDTEVISPDWLRELVSFAMRPEIGAVGARLLYGDRRIQHGGVLLGIGEVAGHAHRFFDSTSTGYCDRLVLTQELSAVTAACLALRREVYLQVGGMNTEDLRVAFNDVDFCLCIGRAGYRNVWTPYAELMHYESATRGADTTPEQRATHEREVAYMKRTWGGLLQADPAYNPNLSLVTEWFWLAKPPRSRPPWQAGEALPADRG